MMVGRSRRAGLCLALLIAFGAARPSVVSGQVSEGILSLIEPGSRADHGLGGDPFLSPLADESGWWGRFDPRVENSASWRAELAEPVAVRRGPKTWSMRSRGYQCRIDRRLLLGGRDLLVQTAMESPRTRWNIMQSDGGLRMSGVGWTIEGAARWEALRGTILQAQAPSLAESRSGAPARWGVGLRFARYAPIMLQGSYVENDRPDEGYSLLLSERMPFSLNLRSATGAYDFRLALNRSAEIEGSLTDTRWTPIREGRGGDSYELLPQGHLWSNQWSIAWKFKEAGRAILRGTWMEADIEATATLGMMRFARLSYLQAEEQAWLGGVDWTTSSRSRILLECETIRFSGKTNGYVESWPFTSTIIDLLGIQQNLRATAEGRLTRLHGALRKGWGSGWIEGGLSGYRISPSVRAMTWQPGVFGMGWRDLHRYAMDSAHGELGAVSTGIGLTIFGCDLTLGIRQFVLAKFTGRLEEDREGGTPPDRPDQGPAAGRTRGGTFLDFRIGRKI
jgi:hypothetical protein